MQHHNKNILNTSFKNSMGGLKIKTYVVKTVSVGGLGAAQNTSGGGVDVLVP